MLRQIDIPGLDLDNVDYANIGLSFSGGGFRAMIGGAGIVAALDDRVDEASDLAGLFQASSYMSGLSGGSWLVGSLYHNDMPTTLELRDSEHVWNLFIERFGIPSLLKTPSDEISIESVDDDDLDDELDNDDDEDFEFSSLFPLDYVRYYTEIHREVQSKAEEGFQVSIVDYWGRGLALNLINSTRGGVNKSWSDIPQYDYWTSDDPWPVPIVIADERKYYRTVHSAEPTVIEFTPYEMGSWSYTLGAFANLKHVGTDLYNGRAYQAATRLSKRSSSSSSSSSSKGESECITKFDNVGFVMGSSSAVFNDLFFLYPGYAAHNETVTAYLLPGRDGKTDYVINGIPHSNPALWSFRPLARERAYYRPNPFFAFQPNEENFNVTHTRDLYLVDGGVDGQNMPIESLLQNQRGLDVILAFDFSADFEDWPSALSLRHSALKFRQGKYNISFPFIPRWIKSGSRFDRTMFLGCKSTDYRTESIDGPVIIYIPNTGYNIESNIPTMQLLYTHEKMSQMMENGWNIATKGNSSDWSTCVACAVLLRSFQRQNVDPPQACQACYDEYCYSRIS